MLPTAKRIVTWRTEHSPRTLVEKLDFVTAAGNLAALITPIAVFQRRNGRLALESWHPQSSLEESRQTHRVQVRCEWCRANTGSEQSRAG